MRHSHTHRNTKNKLDLNDTQHILYTATCSKGIPLHNKIYFFPQICSEGLFSGG